LFEDFDAPATAAECANVDVTAAPLDDLPAYCVLVAWHALERQRAIDAGALEAGPQYALAWVSRSLGVGDPRDFDTYRPGADLRIADLTLDRDGKPTLGASSSLLVGCGLAQDATDVRGPAVSWDGKKIAFAARVSAQQPFRLYESNADGSGCAPIAGIAAVKDRENGILTHDFDPAYAPDGRIVFTSTRGNVGGEGFAYEGPQRTPSQLAPNANLYVYDARQKSIRQLTYLLNQELQPSFMADGRLIFSAEKRAAEFFQLALRRQNLDGGDYHPLFAQRNSVGFEMASEVIELPSRNLAFVAAPFGAKDGAGSIAIVNRSIGPDQSDRSPKDPYFIHSLHFPAPGAFDRATGVYRSPAALPSRWMIVSCDQSASDLKKGNFDFDLCALDPLGEQVAHLGGEAGRADVEAVAVYARENRGVFMSRVDEVNAHTIVDPKVTDAEVHVSDLPLLATLLFSNTRIGRPIDRRVKGVDVLESLPPPTDAKTFSALDSARVGQDKFGSYFADYELLGNVGLYADGSTKFRFAGGHPIVLRVTDEKGRALEFAEGAPFTGEMIQREEMQFYPGERANQGFRRELFDGMCGGCHGSITGFELDVAVNIDVMTSASKTQAHGKPPADLLR
jgi:hypothetical protein